MSLKVVLFDVGGTLINYPITLEDSARRFVEHKDAIGLPETVVSDVTAGYLELRRQGLVSLREATIRPALEDALQKAGLTWTDGEIARALRFLYQKFFGDVATLIDGVKQLLCYVRRRGLPLGLISNTAWSGHLHEEDLRHFEVLDGFGFRLWTSEFGYRKPYGGLFLRGLEHFGILSSEAVYIGDSFDRDVAGPNAVGIRSIWVSGKTAPATFDGWQARDLYEVKEILAKIS